MGIELRLVSSLEKVFCERELDAPAITTAAGARGERAAFQLAVRDNEGARLLIKVDTALPVPVTLREVRLVPCELPVAPDDPFVLRNAPGLYPDPLVPLKANADGEWRFRPSPKNWHAIWVSLDVPADAPAGEWDVTLTVRRDPARYSPWGQGEAPAASATLRFAVRPYALPPQRLVNVNWFYVDCIASYYHLEPWGEALWAMLEKYFRDMAAHGNNALYTPLWTPPLDTAIGGERPTTQLLTISESGGQWRFDFSLLQRWIDLGRQCGIEYFEMSHFFTQWGAGHAPKIIVNGEKRFGWDDAADGPEYRAFLSALLPPLLDFLRQNGLQGKAFFHISDEPGLGDLERYAAAVKFLRQWIDEDEFPVIDAMSNVEFWRQGLLKRPVPITSEVDKFQQEPIAERWVYYCGNWQDDVPNRSYGMPSIRCRVMGVLLYLYEMRGFLHWGYNFWHTQYSLDTDNDPWRVTDAGRAFIGGDSYNVLPGPEGPIDCLHFETFLEGLQDLRALQLLEEKIGREKTVALVQEGVPYRIDMRHYPHEAGWLLDLRARVDAAIVG